MFVIILPMLWWLARRNQYPLADITVRFRANLILLESNCKHYPLRSGDLSVPATLA